MSRTPSMKVKRWISSEELKRLIRKKERDVKVLNRLHFINYLYSGCSVPEASETLGITKVTGYIWLKRWNEEGRSGLIPKYSGGRPPKITEEDKGELKESLSKRNNWTTREVRDLIREKFDVDYSLKRVREILKSLGMKYAKPYVLDYRRPDEAGEILKKTWIRR